MIAIDRGVDGLMLSAEKQKLSILYSFRYTESVVWLK